jgi:quinol monooxygenase YgiN
MFAVIGSWAVDGALEAEQLTHIADTVRQQPGFVRGYWGQDPHNLDAAHAVAIFDDQAHAQAMADGVTAAIASAQLHVVEVLAEA